MAEPPFQMPGHRWDPDKKRFFKILPGQTPALDSSSASGSTGSGSGRAKGKQKDKQAEEGHFASTPRLPAIDLRSSAQKGSGKHTSAFRQARLDPVTLRQHGASQVNARIVSERSRIEAAYSHLSLFTARRPLSSHAVPDTIINIESDLDGYALVVVQEWSAARIVPDHGISQKLFEARYPDSMLFIWKGSVHLLCGVYLERWGHLTFLPLYEPRPERPRRPRQIHGDEDDFGYFDDSVYDENYEIPYWISPETADFMQYDFPYGSPSNRWWAFAETIPPPRDAGVEHNEVRPVRPERLQSTIAYALAAGSKVTVREYEFEVGTRRGFRATDASHRFYSDVMVVAFDSSKEALYCGLRSGQVFVWRKFYDVFRDDPTEPVEMSIEAEGSVTNIAIVSSSEMLVVRINGQVQLVNIATAQVMRRFQGHVNSYEFTLGFAVDNELRLFALAGTDRRVRVWSLDSPLPLGTSATSLSPVFHRHHHDLNGQRLDHEVLYDESGTERFTQTHAATDDRPVTQRGSTLSSVVFPEIIRVLHWHPRYPYEGFDPHQVEALREEQGADYRPPEQRWKDLYVAAGQWLYQFRFS